MKAAILSIGDELLIGQTINTNASYIGNLLTENQTDIVRSSVIGDDRTEILNEFDYCAAKADAVIVTGGLGPTHDDITRSCILEYFSASLIKDERVYQDIAERFARLNRVLTPLNEDQAMVPESATIMRNLQGTAPGYILKKGNCTFFFMPGVPTEMKAMMQNYVVPEIIRLRQDTGSYTIMSTLLTTGIPESALFQKLGNLDELLKGNKLAFLPSQFGVKLRITVKAENNSAAQESLIEIEQKIRSVAGRYIYGKGEESLAEVVGRLLKERGQTVAVAESCTGGGIANQLTNVAGSSAYFERGVVSYSNAAKVEILNVNEDLIMEKGAVSEEVALEMAIGIKAISGSDIGLSATGIMGPSGGSAEKPVGTVFIGIASQEGSYARHYLMGDNRLLNKDRVIQAALELLRRHLLGIPFEN
ncbi:MAG: Nicotinamide-nucleotide amidohydrolase PncC [Ignavibacteriaceae bacterium]|nr:Nicotinamide-nucleotide amidohydrolase PncC [Ignavibacteriaceae bacterium]